MPGTARKILQAAPNWPWRFALRRKGKIHVCFYCFTFFEEGGDCAICGRKTDAYIRPWKPKDPAEKPAEKTPEEKVEILDLFRKEEK